MYVWLCVFSMKEAGGGVLGFESTGTGSRSTGNRGTSLCHRGNRIIVWVDSLDPRLVTLSVWSKPVECLSEWIPVAAIRACPIFISMHFKRNSNSFTFNSLPSRGPTVMWPSPLVMPPYPTPSTTPPTPLEMNSPDRCHTAQNDNLPFGNQPLAPLCSLKLS